VVKADAGELNGQKLPVPVANKFRRQWKTIECARCLKFMEDLIIPFFQFLFEFLIEIFGYSPIDWFFPDKWPESLIGRCIAWFILGCGLATASILLLNHTWISHPTLRTANLALAPITSAFISEAIARHRSKHNESIIPRNHFWQAFWFTLGIVTVRFAYAARH